MVEAAGSVAAVAETGALTPCLTDIAGGGMQVEEDVDDLENTQVTELGRKMERRQRLKGNAHALRGTGWAEAPPK